MNYKGKAFEHLELSKVKNLIIERCHSKLAKNKALEIRPSKNKDYIEKRLSTISQLQSMLKEKFTYNFEDVIDIKKYLTDYQHNYYGFEEFRAFHHLFAASMQLNHDEEKWEDFEQFNEIKENIDDFSELEKKYCKIFDPEGNVKDSASSKLKQLRKNQKDIKKRINKEIQAKFKNKTYKNFIQDEIITERDDRIVIPVKETGIKFVDGIVHGKSSSKSSIYVEPQEIVELNNSKNYLKEDEKEEIIRIFTDYTKEIIENKKELMRTQKNIAQLDLFLAIAQFSDYINANSPRIVDENYIHLISARHPLLINHFNSIKKVIPFDLEIGKKKRVIVISGPNTGGKTVTIKSVGLLALMALCGLPIPAHEDSQIGIFSKFFADIGDEQSLEKDLSTFSSHMENLKDMIKYGDDSSLFLGDEIGSATDPEQGSALAQAILEKIVKNKIVAVVTTHYTALKMFAEEHPYCENAAMFFDHKKHQPTYKFKPGLPGNSFAIEIAEQIGLDSDIIKKAKELAGKQSVELTNLLKKISNEKKALAKRNYELTLKQKLLEKKIDEYKIGKQKLQKEKKSLKKRSITETREYLSKLQKDLNSNLDRIKKMDSKAKKRNVKKTLKRVQNLNAELNAEENKLNTDTLKKVSNPQIGQYVWVNDLKDKGTIVEIGKDKIKVDMGGFIFSTGKDNIYQAVKTDNDSIKTNTNNYVERDFKSELKLLGKTFGEALPLLENYIDQANLSNMSKIRIVHGKGTGALRKKIRNYLRKNKFIKNYYSPVNQAGGTGVTIAELVDE